MDCPHCLATGKFSEMEKVWSGGGFDHFCCPACHATDEAPSSGPCRCDGGHCTC